MFPSRWARFRVTLLLCPFSLAACTAVGSNVSDHLSMPTSATAKKGTSSPETRAPNDLLYVSRLAGGAGVSVFTYPKGKLVGNLTGFQFPFGLCSDQSGNVFVVDQGAEDIVEFSHGGSTPVATLSDKGNNPNGCSVDPLTGNLAVAGGNLFVPANIAVYPHAEAPPTIYKDSTVVSAFYCTYDNNGNLFASAGAGQNEAQFALLELPSGSDPNLSRISLDQSINPGGAIQWDGKYLAIASPPSPPTTRGPMTVYQVSVSGSSGTVVSTIEFPSGKQPRNAGSNQQFWIQGKKLISPSYPTKRVKYWRYPGGGNPIGSVVVGSKPFGVTVSVGSR